MEYFENQLPMMAETYGGIQIYSIMNSQQLRMYSEGTSGDKMKGYSWVLELPGLYSEQHLVGPAGLPKFLGDVWRALRVALAT